MQFIVDTGQMPVAASTGPTGRIDHRGTYETHKITLHDRRGLATSIDVEGFERVDHPTTVVDFHDRAELDRVYGAELEALVKTVTGARRVAVFDWTLRTSDTDEQLEKVLREPLAVAHNDYTETSGPARLRLALPDEADALSQQRFAIVQVWRPTHAPVSARPLALCDAQTVRAEDLLLTERRHQDRVGYIYHLLHHRDQHWCWFPELRRTEALVFKVYDSDASKARFTPHGSPILLDAPAAAAPRRSIEARTLAFY